MTRMAGIANIRKSNLQEFFIFRSVNRTIGSINVLNKATKNMPKRLFYSSTTNFEDRNKDKRQKTKVKK